MKNRSQLLQAAAGDISIQCPLVMRALYPLSNLLSKFLMGMARSRGYWMVIYPGENTIHYPLETRWQANSDSYARWSVTRSTISGRARRRTLLSANWLGLCEVAAGVN